LPEPFASFLSSAANPAVLFFLIGLMAPLLRVELPIPNGFKAVLTIYLMAAIGFKGGVAVAETGIANIWLQMLGLGVLAAVTPLWIYPIARYIGRLTISDSIALGAHYGSVSAVTFATAIAMLTTMGIEFEGAAPAFLAVMEVPGIIMALALFKLISPPNGEAQAGMGHVVGQVLRSKSIFVLIGALIAGYLSGPPGLAVTAKFFVTPFQGVLTLFLLEMGMEAGRRLSTLRRTGLFLLPFAIIIPLLQGHLGVMVGIWLGLSPGGAALIGTLSASASYIAAPVAVRLMVPDASPTVYLTSALGITFPFNVVIGIPLYLAFAQLMW